MPPFMGIAIYNIVSGKLSNGIWANNTSLNPEFISETITVLNSNPGLDGNYNSNWIEGTAHSAMLQVNSAGQFLNFTWTETNGFQFFGIGVIQNDKVVVSYRTLI